MATLVAVGDAGKLATSSDALTWTQQTSGVGANALYGLAWSPALSLFVATGTAGKLATSSDGVDWTQQTSGFGTDLVLCVEWSPALGLFAIGGQTGRLSTSPDGITWTSRVSGFATNQYIRTLAWSPFLGLFVAAGEGGKVSTSSDGITWTATTPSAQVFYGLAWSPNVPLFVATSASGGILTSPDAVTWTARTSGFGTSTIQGVAWSPTLSLFVAVGDLGKLATSPDGITWTSRTSSFGTTKIWGIAWSPALSLFVASGFSGTIATSSDGTTWTQRTSGFSTSFILRVAETSVGIPTSNGNAPVSAASTSTATTVTTVTGSAPVLVGSSSAASVVGSSVVTGTAPVAAGSSSEASILSGGAVASTTGSAPVSVGSSSSASVVGLMALTTNLSRPSTIEITSDAIEVDYTPPFAEVDAEGLPPINTIAIPAVVTIPGYPAVTVERVLTRKSVTVPAMAPGLDGKVHINDAVYDAYPTVTADVGVVHTIIGGQDVTYFRGSPIGGTEHLSSPFGDIEASVSFPQITPQDQPGVGVLSWLDHDKTFERIMVHPSGSVRRLWSGHLISDDGGNDASGPRTSWSAVGTLFQASTFGHRVPLTMKPADSGTIIARSMNRVIGRVYPVLPVVATGIMTTDRGSSTDSELTYVENLLAKMWASNGRQWTVMKTPGSRNTYRLGQKDMTTVHHTVTTGQRAVEVNLSRDKTSTVNCILGHGILPNGYAWSGRVWPNFHPDTTPEYPFAVESNVITVGTTDAMTDSGSGVSDWQQKVNDLNLTPNVVVDGVFNTNDSATLLVIQKDAGLTEDGILGPQSWAGTFNGGDGNSGDLFGSYRRPLAIHTATEPYLYSASGAVIGSNPGYAGSGPGGRRYELDINYGAGSTRAQAKVSATLQIARDRLPGYTGTITLLADSREDSRFFIIPNQNIKLIGYNGRDVLLHVVSVDRDYDSLAVTLTVDEKARDAMTVASIRERDKASKADPARRPGFTPKRSGLEQDLTVEFDGDSEAGIVKKTALYGGLWIRIPFPLSQVGSIAKIELTTSPPTKFYVSLFNSTNVTPAHMVANIGDPSTGTEPWARTDAKGAALDALGLIQGYGTAGAACGYGLKSEGTGTLSGEFEATSPQTYNAQEDGAVSLLVYAEGACSISGRVYPSPVQ